MTELERKVLDSIRRQNLAPRPPLFFLAKRSVFWTLAGLSVALGAVAIAGLVFAAIDWLETGGRGFEEMPLDDVFEHLPFVWGAMLALFTASAVYSFRRTRRGHRHRTGVVVAIAVLASLALGGLLHLADAGPRTHEFIAKRWPAYARFTTPADLAWSDPDEGRLAGGVIGYDGVGIVTLEDFDGRVWTVDVAGATLALDEPLGSDEDVAITGERTGPTSFRASSIGEWD